VADFAVTQFFFELAEYVGLVEDLAARGVTKPVLPGILPVTSLRSMARLGPMGAAMPEWGRERLEAAGAAGGAAAVRREGVAMAVELCRGLVEVGAPGLHFYTFNRSTATREIYEALELG
jgi:methylenetetrahydrofolate reductase (NADPH)